MGRLGKAFKMAKRKPGAGDEDGEGSGSEAEQAPQQPKQQQQQAPPPPNPKTAAAAAADADADEADDDPSSSGGAETRGQMVQRHKRELLALKKNATRGKGKAEAAKAVADLESRHAKELSELDGKRPAEKAAASSAPSAAADPADRASKYLAGVSLADNDAADEITTSGKGPTKAQKRRDKLAQREQERDARIAAELAALGPTERLKEQRTLRALLAPMGLAVKGIRADGHCLYHSIADQLEQHPTSKTAGGGEGGEEEEGGQAGGGGGRLPDYLSLRRLCAEHMRLRRADFEPFVAAAAAEDLGKGKGAKEEEEEEEEGGGDRKEDDDPFEAYVSSVEKTAAWGGHVELTALAGALKRRVRVVSAGMPGGGVEAGEEFEGEPLTVCYVRHELGLGEHYNSVRPKGEDEDEDEDEDEEESEEETAKKEEEDDDDE